MMGNIEVHLRKHGCLLVEISLFFCMGQRLIKIRENQTMWKRFNISKNRSIHFTEVNFTFIKKTFSRLSVFAGGFIRGWFYTQVGLKRFTAIKICGISWKKILQKAVFVTVPKFCWNTISWIYSSLDYTEMSLYLFLYFCICITPIFLYNSPC